MKIYSEFKNIPWKNGKGVTTELIKIDSKVGNVEFGLRLSKAKIDTNGAFSQFSDLKRILVLLTGQGIKLSINHQDPIILNNLHSPIYFNGDDSVSCELISGPCFDFNIIYNPIEYAINLKYHLITKNQFFEFTAPQNTFLFYIANEEISEQSNQLLIELSQNETIKKNFKHQGHLYSVVLTSPKQI